MNDCNNFFDLDSIYKYLEFEKPLYSIVAKGRTAELKYMSPKQYVYTIARHFGGLSYDDVVSSGAVRPESIKKYAEDMKRGDKFPVPYYTDSKGLQEGRHRALAAMSLGCESIPVIEFRNLTNEEFAKFVEKFKDFSFDGLGSYFRNYLQFKDGITQLGFNDLKRYADYNLRESVCRAIRKIIIESTKENNIYYHGSKYKFDEFKMIDNKTYQDFDVPSWFFTENKEYAKTYGNYLYSVRLHVNNIFDLTEPEHYEIFMNQLKEWYNTEEEIDAVLDQFSHGLPYWTCGDAFYIAKMFNFDSILIQEELERDVESVAVFDVENIEIVSVENNIEESVRKVIRKTLKEEEDNYSAFKGREPYSVRREKFLNTIQTFNDIKEDDYSKIIEFIGLEGHNSEEDAIEGLKDKMMTYQQFSDPVKLYRVIAVKNKKRIDTKELGQHFTPFEWVIDGDMIMSIGSESWDDDWKPYIMEVLVPLGEIDVWQTITQNLSFPNEHEVNLKNNGKGAKFLKAYRLK